MTRAEPSFARRSAGPRRHGRQWPVLAGIAMLALLLALQLLLAQRDALAADPRWRPLVDTTCGAVGCTVQPWREPTAFTMLDRSVQPKAGTRGVLSAQATFRNDAQWPQPWPTLVLSLSGVDGQTLGTRAFEPHEYAGGPVTALAPGQSARVQLDIVEPAPNVVAFSFDFR